MRPFYQSYLRHQKIVNSILLGLALVWTCLIYLPGLNGGFIFDDYPNILFNKWIQISDFNIHEFWRASFSSDAGSLKRPIAMLSFAINHVFSELNPYYYKITNLVIHLANGILVFLLSRLLCRILLGLSKPTNPDTSAVLLCSLTVTIYWLIHPFNVSTVLYVVQRMTSLAACFTLLGLYFYLIGRIKLSNEINQGWYYIAICYLICLPLSVLSKESGILLIPYTALIEFSLTSRLHLHASDRKILRNLFIGMIGLPSMACLIILCFKSDSFLKNYEFRKFTLEERLLSESRVMFFYLKQILLPNITEMSLFHDDFSISRSLLSPLTTLFSAIGLVALSCIAIWKRNLAISFGVLFFLCSHLLESTIIPLELVFEHRNYLATFGIQFGVCYSIFNANISMSAKKIAFSTLAILILACSYLTWQRATDWRSPLTMAYTDALNHPNSERSNFEVAGQAHDLTETLADPVLRQKYYDLAKKFYQKTIETSSSNVQGVFGLINLECQQQKAVQKELIDLLGSRLQTGEVPANINLLIYLLTNKIKANNCDINKDDLLNALLNVLKNPKNQGNRLSASYYGLAVFMANSLKNNEKAIEYLKSAVKQEPDALEYRLLLIKIYMALGRNQEANAEIITLKKLDVFNIHEPELIMLNSQLKKPSARMKDEQPK